MIRLLMSHNCRLGRRSRNNKTASAEKSSDVIHVGVRWMLCEWRFLAIFQIFRDSSSEGEGTTRDLRVIWPRISPVARYFPSGLKTLLCTHSWWSKTLQLTWVKWCVITSLLLYHVISLCSCRRFVQWRRGQAVARYFHPASRERT